MDNRINGPSAFPYLILPLNSSQFSINNRFYFAVAFGNNILHKTRLFVRPEVILQWSKSSLISSLQLFSGLLLGTLPVTFICQILLIHLVLCSLWVNHLRRQNLIVDESVGICNLSCNSWVFRIIFSSKVQ